MDPGATHRPLHALSLLVGLTLLAGCSDPGGASEADTGGTDAAPADTSSTPEDTATGGGGDDTSSTTSDTTGGSLNTAGGSSDTAGGSTPSCQALCDRVYGECGLFLQYYTADKVPKSGCVSACDWGYFIGERRCIMQRECSKETLNDCISVETATPDLESLDPADDWPETWKDFERQVFALVNLHRRRGVTCGDTTYEPTDPLEWNGDVAEAARAHSLDMAKNDFYEHIGSDDSTPAQRIARTDYGNPRAAGEAINRTFATPFTAVKSLLESTSHCRRMVSPDHPYLDLGAGYVHAPDNENTHLWTVNYAAP